MILLLHLLFVGLWLGCVLTEVLFERALLARGEPLELVLAQLHWRVDLFVETPAFLGVLATGAWMATQAPLAPLILLKITAGLLAIAANAWCVALVYRRFVAARAGNRAAFACIDRQQHRIGAVVLLAILGALGIGLH